MCLCLAIGAVAFNGKEAYPKDPTDEKSDFSCDEKERKGVVRMVIPHHPWRVI